MNLKFLRHVLKSHPRNYSEQLQVISVKSETAKSAIATKNITRWKSLQYFYCGKNNFSAYLVNMISTGCRRAWGTIIFRPSCQKIIQHNFISVVDR